MCQAIDSLENKQQDDKTQKNKQPEDKETKKKGFLASIFSKKHSDEDDEDDED